MKMCLDVKIEFYLLITGGLADAINLHEIMNNKDFEERRVNESLLFLISCLLTTIHLRGRCDLGHPRDGSS